MEQMTQMTRLMMDRAKDPMSITDAVKMLEEGAISERCSRTGLSKIIRKRSMMRSIKRYATG